MDSLIVPASGLTLTGRPASNLQTDPANVGAKSPQVLQLDLTQGVLEELLKNAVAGGKGIHVSFGKVPTLHYGSKSHQLLTTPLPSQSELYSYSTDCTNELTFAGLLSHKLAMKKAQDNLAGTDAALAMLQGQMASHRQNKQSKQIKFVPDSSDLPPPVQVKQATLKASSLAQLKKHKASSRLNAATTRSMPSSPAIGASRSLAVPPTSVPTIRDEKNQKLQALRTPLVHLLAVRQVSVKFLAQKICCTQEECREVLQKVGREFILDNSKWDLSDKSFKELDVWKFPYPCEADRQFAIDHAVSAFDRMRISREENLWQMLLPKDERGKGKILSKLNLHVGPMQKSSTPRINVHPTDDSIQTGQETGNDSDRKDRLAPSDAEPMVRSKSHDQITKKKVSEKEAQSKRLLSKKPKKPVQASKSKEAQPNVKKGTKKEPAASSNVPKSTEFVHDSDEDVEMGDVGAVQPKHALTHSSTKEAKKAPQAVATKVPGGSAKPRIPEQKRKINAPSSTVAGKKLPTLSSSGSSQGSISMSKSLSHQRSTSSPHKPSPLGSSPPTNASDLDNDSLSLLASSTSSTPLVAQARKTNNPTQAALLGNSRSTPQPAQNNSDNSLKRKANTIDSSIHNHNHTLVDGPINSTKRQKGSILSPPTSDSSNSSPPPIRSETIDLAQRFKTFHAKYEKQYRELTGCRDPPKEEVDKLLKMHDRLVAMKDEISRSVVVG